MMPKLRKMASYRVLGIFSYYMQVRIPIDSMHITVTNINHSIESVDIHTGHECLVEIKSSNAITTPSGSSVGNGESCRETKRLSIKPLGLSAGPQQEGAFDACPI